MTHSIRAELRGMRSVGSIRLVAVGAVAVAVVAAVFDSGDELTALLHTEIVVLTLFALIAGAIAGAGDFQHGTVVWTLLAAPNRLSSALAKVTAAAVLGVAIAAGVLGATWAVGAVREGGMPAGTGVGELVVGQLVLGMLTVAFGTAVGLALRNLPTAVGAVFTIALLLPLVFQAKQSLADEARFLPYGELSASALALGSAPADFGPQLGTIAAGLVLLAWTAVVAAIGLGRFVREDVG